MIAILIIVIIGFVADILSEHMGSKVCEFVSDICMRVCLLLGLEVLILLVIQIFI